MGGGVNEEYKDILSIFNQQHFENYVIFRSRNQFECCTRRLEWVHKCHEVPEEPRIDLAPLMGDTIS